MHTRNRAAGLVVLGAVLLTGCGALAPAPSTTYTDASGATVTVDWADYPAHAGMDGEARLGRPDQRQLEASARTLVGDIRDAIEQSAGVAMTASKPEATWFGEEDWFPQAGNGYGGESMLVTVNCCDLVSEGIPDPSRWPAVIDAVSEVTRDAGLGPLRLAHESEAMAADPAWREEHRATYCTMPDGGCWQWSADASDDVAWVHVLIQDTALDPTGDAAREAEELGWPAASISVGYGATVVRAGMTEDFERAMAPFRGLDRPEATTSD